MFYCNDNFTVYVLYTILISYTYTFNKSKRSNKKAEFLAFLREVEIHN